jgi:uncharacterized damage-inducible protein DinB
MAAELASQELGLTADALYAHWQGHRRLTRRVIEAFPEKELFEHSLGGMRTFAELATELLRMDEPILRGVVTAEWTFVEDVPPSGKADLLAKWDEATASMDALWPKLPAGRLQEEDTAFGQWKGQCYTHILYAVDNEIHHRGQGYVYLRTLGIEPPPFWER